MLKPEEVKTLSGLFSARVKMSADKIAYSHYDIAQKEWISTTWQECLIEVGHWQQALEKENFTAGDRVAIMLPNGRNWVVFDQAALGLQLVTVPLYVDDRAENIAYILQDSGCKLIVVEGKRQWKQIQQVSNKIESIQTIVSIQTIEKDDEPKDSRLISLSEWLYGLQSNYKNKSLDPNALASIVYTSGTTGKSKGVMLSHNNMLQNSYGSSLCANVNENDLFLSFLPLSHTLERTA